MGVFDCRHGVFTPESKHIKYGWNIVELVRLNHFPDHRVRNPLAGPPNQ